MDWLVILAVIAFFALRNGARYAADQAWKAERGMHR